MKKLIASLKAWITKIRAKQAGREEKNPHHSFRRTPSYLWRQDLVGSLRSSWSLTAETFGFMRTNKKVILGLGVIYAVLAYFLVGGLSQADYSSFKDASQKIFGGDLGAVTTAFSLFGATLGGAFNAPQSQMQQFLSGLLSIIFWLSLVWAARMLTAGKPIKIRDALYNGSAPLISSLVVMVVMSIQLLPAAIGIFAFATVSNGQWLHGGVEAMVFAAAAFLLSLLSLYWLASSIIGLVVVTLPGMYPLRALATSRDLVVNHRSSLIIRLISMGLIGLVVWGLTLIPIFMLDNWLRFSWLPLVPVTMQILVGFTLVFSSVYVYKLYRSLL